MVSGYKPINKKLLGGNIKSLWTFDDYGMGTIWKHQLNSDNKKSLLIINDIFMIPSYEEYPYILDCLHNFSNKYSKLYIISVDMNLRQKFDNNNLDIACDATAIFFNHIMNMETKDTIDIMGLNRGGNIAVKLISQSNIFSTLYLWNHIGMIPQIIKPVFIGLSLKEILKDNRYHESQKYRTRVYDDVHMNIKLEIYPDFILDFIIGN